MGKHIVDDDDETVGLEEFDGEDGTEDAPEIPVETESDEPTETDKAQERGKAEPESAASETEDEVESYSKRVQKRINKLTGNVKRLEQETSYWKERVAALESKHSAKEMSDFQTSLAESESKLMANYKAAQADYKKAVEEGDVDAQIEIQEKVLDLREQLAEKRRMAAIAKEQADKLQQTPSPAARPDSSASESAGIPEHLPTGTKAWLKENAWFMKGADAKAANYARTLDAELQEEGYSPDDPAMYAELNKRLRVLVPRLAARIRDVAVAGKSPTPPRARVAGSSPDGQRGGSEPASGAKPKRVLTTDDVSAMRRYGMDPKNVDHRKAWLRRNDPL